MRTGIYTFGELFRNRHIEQILIPEIQRDYVWGKKEVHHLLHSILSNFKSWRDECSKPSWTVTFKDGSDSLDLRPLTDDFARFYSRRIHATNVGFVYAYSDADLPGQYFLIDGQQRLTTLYLVLLAASAQVGALKEEFRSGYCLNNGRINSAKALPTKLDYRLREHSAEFMHRFVHHVLENDGVVTDLGDQEWYLRHYAEDPTIRNIISNYLEIQSQMVGAKVDTDCAHQFFEYLEDLVNCWYFDTNQSAQGEELYIYLNARGEGLAGNEIEKATYLREIASEEMKNSWGHRWEEWQGFFWRHRRSCPTIAKGNPDADIGFNEFLACLKEFYAFIGTTWTALSAEERLALISEMVGRLGWFGQNRKLFKECYDYAEWVDKCWQEFWVLINRFADARKGTDWGADWTHDNKSTERNRMVFVWGILLCLKAVTKEEEVVPEDQLVRIFRAIRFVYLRYHNNNRSVKPLPDLINKLLQEEPANPPASEGFLVEERDKLDALCQENEPKRRRYESVIWKIEDHPLNLDGRDVGMTNVSHLVELKPLPLLEELEVVRDAFYRLFPPSEPRKYTKLLQSILLFYGPYWNSVPPWVYLHYECDNWRRTIRGKGSAEVPQIRPVEKTAFRRFLDDYRALNQQVEPGEFLKQKVEGSPPPQKPEGDDEESLRMALLWYFEKVGQKIWEAGDRISVDVTSPFADTECPSLFPIYNLKKDYRGQYRGLSNLLPERSKKTEAAIPPA